MCSKESPAREVKRKPWKPAKMASQAAMASRERWHISTRGPHTHAAHRVVVASGVDRAAIVGSKPHQSGVPHALRLPFLHQGTDGVIESEPEDRLRPSAEYDRRKTVALAPMS